MTIQDIAKKLVSDGKGIFAADTGAGSTEKRLAEHGLKGTTPEERRVYRDVLFTVKGLGEYVGGVIMNEESFRQNAMDGRKFTEVLESEGVMPGVKVDKGVIDMAGFPNEKITEGLDGLRERLVELATLGAKFSKWRAVINIDDKLPTRANIVANAHALARYAGLCQEAGIVPIIEPELLMDGAHSLERSAEVTEMVCRTTFDVLLEQRVDPTALLYKSNMAVMGKKCETQESDIEIAKATVAVLRKTVSVGVPGVIFLSGGQDPMDATRRLNEIAKVGAGAPWRWTFSFERGFEAPVMKIWKGTEETKEMAQKELLHRAKMNSLASLGTYNALEDK